jgi:hypothetical protein
MSIDTYNADRRGFLKCMTWAGSAMVVWTVAGGIPRARIIGQADAAETGFTFAQVSDSHLGFNKPVNTDVAGTFQEALGHVTSMEDKPAFLIHTGDITPPVQRVTRQRLFSNTAATMQGVPLEIVERQLTHFAQVDPAYAAGVRAAFAPARQRPEVLSQRAGMPATWRADRCSIFLPCCPPANCDRHRRYHRGLRGGRIKFHIPGRISRLWTCDLRICRGLFACDAIALCW